MTPPLIIGAWQLSAGHRAGLPEKEALFEAWAAMVDAGLTTFDCADIYTGVEALLGEFVRWYAKVRGEERAGAIRIHTKYVPDRDDLATLTRQDVERIVHRSLQRLGTGRLDLVQFAWWDYGVGDPVRAAQWLDELRLAGDIDQIGATNFDAEHLGAILDAGVPVVAHQVQYSVLDRRPVGAMTDLCAQHDVAMLCYGTLAGGFLTDRYLGAVDPDGPMETRSLTKYRLIIEEFGGWDAYQALLATLADIGAGHGVATSAVALRWVLDQARVGAAIVGASSARHLHPNLAALTLELTPEDRDRLGSHLSAAPGPVGPVFGLERVAGGPHASIMWSNRNRAGGAGAG